METTIKTIMNQLSEMTQSINNGETDPMEGYANFDILLKHVKKCSDEIKEGAMTEMDKHGKNATLYGFKFEKRNGGKTYDFKHLKQWNFLKNEMKNYEQQRINYLENTDGFSEETGEIFEDLPKVKYRSDSLIVKKVN